MAQLAGCGCCDAFPIVWNGVNRFASILFVLLLSTFAAAQSLTTSGAIALISAKQKANLNANQLRLVAPTWIPAGFKLSSLSIEKDKDPVLRYATYRYAKGKAKITIQFASDGIGDPFFDLPGGDTTEPDGYVIGKNAILGEFQLDYVKRAGLPTMWHTNWYELKQKGHPKYVMIFGEGLPIADGKRMIESLRWLK